MIFSGTEQDRGIERARVRVGKMASNDLLDWLDIALSGMMRHLEVYRRTGDMAHLAEVGLAETTANLVITELLDRGLDIKDETPVYRTSVREIRGVPSYTFPLPPDYTQDKDKLRGIHAIQ